MSPAGLRELDLTPVSDEELRRALSVPWNGEEVGRVRPLLLFMPRSPEAARAVEHAAHIYQHAMNLGHAMLGFRDDLGCYLDVALPAMFSEPRSPAAEAMVDVIRRGRLPLVVRHIVRHMDLRPGTNGLRPPG